jgi:hypothetical protein
VRGEGVTLIHRDPHPGNLLYPHHPATATVKLIDWQSYRVDTGTDDIAYFMAFHWPRDERRRLEAAMLRRYYDRLIELGVRDYRWDDCCYDYQASICRMLMVTVSARSTGWERIRRGLAAFVDWNCAEIL